MWEAVYFDHDFGKLTALADRAASVGVERTVLDDGWFLGRRSDRAGMGDWRVGEAVWPGGLHRLAGYVRRLLDESARRAQPAEAGRPGVDRLVPIGHGRPTPGHGRPAPATAGPPPVRQPAHAGRPGQAGAGPWTVRVRPGPAAPGR